MILSIPSLGKSRLMVFMMSLPTKVGSVLGLTMTPLTLGSSPRARFAVESIRHWWKEMGRLRYPAARRLLITADCGGSNGYRVRLWRVALQKFADESGLCIQVCHFPPGTSKWNKIEHRMFCQITRNWRGRPLESRQIVVNLIGSTKTKQGLHIEAQLDEKSYAKGIKVTNKDLAHLAIEHDEFHGEWNYKIMSRGDSKNA
jgi:hypothetical protein